MKKLVCALLLIGATVGLHAKGPDCKPPGHQRQFPHILPHPGQPRGPHGHRFAQVTLQDIQITETEILATIDGQAVPVRALFVGKEGAVFVKLHGEKTVSCPECKQGYTVDKKAKKSTCPGCDTENCCPRKK